MSAGSIRTQAMQACEVSPTRCTGRWPNASTPACRRLRRVLPERLPVCHWVTRIPQVRGSLDISEAMLGLALLAIAVGALAAMNLTGGIADRFGSRLPLIVGLFGSSAAFVLLGWASNVGKLTVVSALGCFGMMVGMVDVTMNLEGAAAERASGKSIFASFHGMHSVGGMVGAGCGALAAGDALSVVARQSG